MNNKFVAQNAISYQPENGTGLLSWINEFLKNRDKRTAAELEGTIAMQTPQMLAGGRAVFYMDVCIDESIIEGVNI